jgi:hypothetical protein
MEPGGCRDLSAIESGYVSSIQYSLQTSAVRDLLFRRLRIAGEAEPTTPAVGEQLADVGTTLIGRCLPFSRSAYCGDHDSARRHCLHTQSAHPAGTCSNHGIRYHRWL